MVRLCLNATAYYSDPPLRVAITIGWDRPTNREFLYIEPVSGISEDYSSPLDRTFYSSLLDRHLGAPLLHYYLKIFVRYKIFIPLEIYQILQNPTICNPDCREIKYDKLISDVSIQAREKYGDRLADYYWEFYKLVVDLKHSDPLQIPTKQQDKSNAIMAENNLDDDVDDELDNEYFRTMYETIISGKWDDSIKISESEEEVPPYKTRLFLGEADFSFSAAFFKKHHDKKCLSKYLTATELRNESELNSLYSSFKEHQDYLIKGGVNIQYGVDATKIHKKFKRIKCIHFNFPHDGNEYEMRTLPVMISKFFKSASKIQKVGDKIYMALPQPKDAEKRHIYEGYRYVIYDAAIAFGYKAVKKRPFNEKRYSGYQHRMTKEDKTADVTENSREFIFRRIEVQPEQYEMLNKSPTEKFTHKGEKHHVMPELETDDDSSDCEDESFKYNQAKLKNKAFNLSKQKVSLKSTSSVTHKLVSRFIEFNASGNDYNIIEHGVDNDRYWYSILDGFRLLLSIRKKYLFYMDSMSHSYPFKAPGEEFSYYRENRYHVLVANPYITEKFTESFGDDIKTITGTHSLENIAKNHRWSHMPTLLVLPILTSNHWRAVRITIDYVKHNINILWDDPFGKNHFSEAIRKILLPCIIDQVKLLFDNQLQKQNSTFAVMQLEKVLDLTRLWY